MLKQGKLNIHLRKNVLIKSNMSSISNKKQKKQKELKTREERQTIVLGILDNFRELGVDIAQYHSLDRFKKILDEYQVDVLESGFSGKYFLPELNRYIEYRLPVSKGIKEVVYLSAK